MWHIAKGNCPLPPCTATRSCAQAPVRRAHMDAISCGPWRHLMYVMCWPPALCAPAPTRILLHFSFVASPNPKNVLFRWVLRSCCHGKKSFAGAGPCSSSPASPGAGQPVPWVLGITFRGWRSRLGTTSLFSSVPRGSSSCNQCTSSRLGSSEAARDAFLFFFHKILAIKKLLKAQMPRGMVLFAGEGRRDPCPALGYFSGSRTV